MNPTAKETSPGQVQLELVRLDERIGELTEKVRQLEHDLRMVLLPQEETHEMRDNGHGPPIHQEEPFVPLTEMVIQRRSSLEAAIIHIDTIRKRIRI